MTLNEVLAKAPAPFATTQRAVKLEYFVSQVHSALGDAHVAPTQLFKLMGVPAELARNAAAWLRLARIEGALNGCYTVGKPSAFTFGKPSYRWHKAKD